MSFNQENIIYDEYETLSEQIEVISWDDFYNQDDKIYIEEALNDMHFSVFASLFHEQKVDMEAFLQLQPHHINRILHNVPVGILIKFEKAYFSWKSLNYNENNAAIPASGSSKKVNPGDVKRILEDEEGGKVFLQNIDREKVMDKIQRSKLMKLLLSHFLKKFKQLSNTDIIDLGHEIIREFPCECISIFCDENTGKGPLHDAYNNMLRKVRSIESTSSKSRKRKSIESDSAVSSPDFSQEELISDEFVRHSTAAIPFNILEMHWKKSSRMRLHKFRQHVNVEVSTLYRALERPDAYLLYDIDFTTLYQVHNDFKEEWQKQESKLIKVLEKNIRNKEMLRSLGDMKDLSHNQKVATIISALHHYLFSPVLKHKEPVYKSSIPNSIKCLLFLTSEIGTREIEIVQWRQMLSTLGFKCQPFIVCCGNETRKISDDFILCVESVEHGFQNCDILSVMEILLKIFHVCNLSYPEHNSNVFEFLSEQFLGIRTRKKIPKVQQLINEMLN